MLIIILGSLAFIAPAIIRGFYLAMYGTPEEIARVEEMAANEMAILYKHHPNLKK